MHIPQPEGPPKPEYSMSSLVEVLRYRARTQPDDLAYTFLVSGTQAGESLTFSQLDARARTLAVRLLRSAAPGDRALLLYPSSLEYVVAFVGCVYAGLIPVPAYPPRRNKPDPRLESIARDANVAISLCDEMTRNAMAAVRDRLPVLEKTQWLTTDTLEPCDGATWQAPDVGLNSLAFLQYTSGSTSDPKGVMVSHGNLLRVMHEGDLSWNLLPGHKMISWLPIFHDMGLIYGILQSAYSGIPGYFMAPLTFMQQPINWLQAISTFRATHSPAPNFAYDLCVDKIDPQQRAELDLSCWQVATIAAEPIRAGTMQRFVDFFAPAGFRFNAFTPGYGMAESTLKITTTCRHEDSVFTEVCTEDLRRNRAVSPSDAGHMERETIDSPPRTQTLVSSGHTLGTTRLVIVDPATCQACPDGEVGEIWVGGPIVAQGYWNRPEKTQETFQAHLSDTGEGPFLRTGDLGFVLDGECYVTGRLKDIVIIRGTNHYPHDIELTVQRSHPALRPDCGAAFSVDVGDEERLVVVQEIRRTYLKKANTDEILTALRRALFEEHELAAHAIVLVRTASILKTSSGKIQRRACRDLFLDDGFPTIASWRLDSAAGASTSSPGAMPAVMAPNIQDWIVKWIAARLERDPLHIRPHDPFDAFGMDSLSAVDLVHDLSGWTGKSIDETTLWNYPTIWDLAQFVARDDDAAAPPPQVRDQEISARQQDDNLDQLSEEELVGLLYEEIQTDEPGG